MNKSFSSIYDAFTHSMRFVNVRSASTINQYGFDVRQFIAYLEDIDIDDFNNVSYEILLTYIMELKGMYAPNTVYRKVASVKVFFQFLKEYEYINQDITAFIKSDRREKNLPKALTLGQIKQLLSFKKEKPKDYLDYTLILLLFRTGLRVSECTNLEFVHFYKEERLLRFIGKGSKERIVPLSEDAYINLEYYLEVVRPLFLKKRTNRIFISATGKLVTRQYIYQMLQLRSKETELRAHVSPHVLRHSMATALLEEEVDLRIIQELLGHSDISTTQIYTEVRKKTLRNEYDKYLLGGFDIEPKKE
jgi:integrase/recombinase XerD